MSDRDDRIPRAGDPAINLDDLRRAVGGVEPQAAPPKFLHQRGAVQGDSAMPRIERPQVRERVPSEADVIADQARHAVTFAQAVIDDINATIGRAKQAAADIERDGLALMERIIGDSADYNRRVADFVASATTIDQGLQATFEKARQTKPAGQA